MDEHLNARTRNGAGTRDRTEDTSLEGWGFTTKLCPQNLPLINLTGVASSR